MIGLAIRLVREPALMQASMNMSFFICVMCIVITNINKNLKIIMQDTRSTNSTADEIMKLRELLAQGLFILGLEYPERFGVLMALRPRNKSGK